MIKMSLIAHVGADAVVNNVNGKQVVNFNACHTEKYKDQNGVENNRSIWVSCAYWSEKVGVAQYIKKGTQIYVEGTPSTDTYTKDGKTFAQLRLRVNNIQLLSSNNQPQTSQQNDKNNSNEAFDKTMGEPLDNLPF